MKAFFAGDAVCGNSEGFEFYMPWPFSQLFEYENYLKFLFRVLGTDFEQSRMGHFDSQKQIIKKTAEVEEELRKS